MQRQMAAGKWIGKDNWLCEEGAARQVVAALRRPVVLLMVGPLLAACSTPVGVAANLRGTYWQHALVTNPNGGGPQIVIWGPPDPFVPDPD